jgi:putative ATP-binding cassette transporter
MFRPALDEYAAHNVRAMSLFTAGACWGQTLLFIFMGLILFVPAVSGSLSAAALSGFVLTLLYVLIPLQGILNAMAPLARADVAEVWNTPTSRKRRAGSSR